MALDGALVSDEHLRALLQEGRARATLEGHEVIQSSPTAYVVDEARGVKDPSGMFCQKIGVAMHAVASQAQSGAGESQAGSRALPPQCRGLATCTLCVGTFGFDRRRNADRLYRHRYGRRLYLHCCLPGG